MKIEIKELTPERVDECEKFIKDSLAMPFAEYLEFFHKNI
jgi:hypothetical protein